MRICRLRHQGQSEIGFYDEKQIVLLSAAANAYEAATHERLSFPPGDNLLDLLPPDGAAFAAAQKLADWIVRTGSALPNDAAVATDKAELLVPIPRPNKLFLLAGNYNEHITEGGGAATE